MPIIGNSPWIDAANTGQGVAQGLGAQMLQVPRARAEARMMQQQLLAQQQQMALQQQMAPYQRDSLAARAGASRAQGDMYSAHAGLYNSQAAGAQQQQKADLDTGLAAGRFMKEAFSNNGQVSPEAAQGLAQAMFVKSKSDPQFMKQVEQMIAVGNSHLKQNPSLQAAVMSGAKVPVSSNVPQGATQVNTLTGQPMSIGAQRLSPGQSVTMPQQVQEPTYNAMTDGSQNPQSSRLAMAAQNQMPQRPTRTGGDPDSARKRAIADIVVKGAGDPSMDMTGSMSNLDRYLPTTSSGQPMSANPSTQIQPGVIYKGYKFLGGNPAKEESWQKMQ